jgi:hypothetical protein
MPRIPASYSTLPATDLQNGMPVAFHLPDMSSCTNCSPADIGLTFSERDRSLTPSEWKARGIFGLLKPKGGSKGCLEIGPEMHPGLRPRFAVLSPPTRHEGTSGRRSGTRMQSSLSMSAYTWVPGRLISRRKFRPSVGFRVRPERTAGLSSAIEVISKDSTVIIGTHY